MSQLAGMMINDTSLTENNNEYGLITFCSKIPEIIKTLQSFLNTVHDGPERYVYAWHKINLILVSNRYKAIFTSALTLIDAFQTEKNSAE